MNGQERNKQSLETLFSAKDEYADMYSKMSGYDIQKDSIGWYIPEVDKHFYSLYDLKKFLNENKKNVHSSRKPIKSSMRMIRHPSVQVYLPFTQYNNSPYNFNGIQINDWGVRLEGSAGGSYAAASTNIDIYNDGTVSVYDTKHHLDNTKYYNLELIHDFLNFFKENIDVMSYLDKPTATGMVSLSSADTYKIKEWADAHKFVQSSHRPIMNRYEVERMIIKSSYLVESDAEWIESAGKWKALALAGILALGMASPLAAKTKKVAQAEINPQQKIDMICDAMSERGDTTIYLWDEDGGLTEEGKALQKALSELGRDDGFGFGPGVKSIAIELANHGITLVNED